jgi:outer membrane protein assembly factor BamB
VSRLADEVIRTMTLTRTLVTTGLVTAAVLFATTLVIFATPTPAPATPALPASGNVAGASAQNPAEVPPRKAGPGDWPLFRGDALMSGVGHAKLPAQLGERWTYKCGDAVEGAPAIANGVVYVGSFDKHLHAIELATGKLKWKVKLSYIKASPSVKGDRVFVGDLDGKFYCLSAADGKVLWTFETGGEIAAGCNFHGDNILIGSHDSTLYCLDPNGKKLWEVITDGPVNGSPVVVGDVTFVAGCDSILHVLDAKTGKELGTVDLEGQAAATAAVHGEFAYVGTMANQVVAVDWKNKKKLWAFEAPARQQPFYASAVVTESLVVAGGRDQKVYGIDRKTGKQAWSFQAAGNFDGSPVVVGDRVYAGCMSSEGEFYVLDLKAGKKIQELNLDSAVIGSIAVGPDCLIVCTDKGTVYSLGGK